jgi:hypothetical protein
VILLARFEALLFTVVETDIEFLANGAQHRLKVISHYYYCAIQSYCKLNINHPLTEG